MMYTITERTAKETTREIEMERKTIDRVNNGAFWLRMLALSIYVHCPARHLSVHPNSDPDRDTKLHDMKTDSVIKIEKQ